MRRKIRPIDPKELIDADDINRTTIKGEMRKLWPAIHQKLIECGWTARDMVKWLDERGVSMSVELFRVYLRDLDREQGYDRSKNEFHSQGVPLLSTQPKPSEKPALVSTPTGSPVVRGHDPPPPKLEETVLVREPGITDAAWNEKQQKHKAEVRRQRSLLNGETK